MASPYHQPVHVKVPEKQKKKRGLPQKKQYRTHMVVASRKKALEISRDGDIMPLEILVYAMRHYYRRFEKNPKKLRDLQLAASYAEKAAPYFHPRMQTIEWKDNTETPKVPPTVIISFASDVNDDNTVIRPKPSTTVINQAGNHTSVSPALPAAKV